VRAFLWLLSTLRRQYEWLSNDLASVNRTATPWVVVSGHRPMYTSTLDAGMSPYIQQILEPVLVANKVDLALWGHVHDYERFCGMTNGTCAKSDEDAPVHVVVGMAGNDYQVDWTGSGHVHAQPDNIVFRSMNFGYARVHASRHKLQLEYVGDVRGAVHDTLELTK